MTQVSTPYRATTQRADLQRCRNSYSLIRKLRRVKTPYAADHGTPGIWTCVAPIVAVRRSWRDSAGHPFGRSGIGIALLFARAHADVFDRIGRADTSHWYAGTTTHQRGKAMNTRGLSYLIAGAVLGTAASFAAVLHGSSTYALPATATTTTTTTTVHNAPAPTSAPVATPAQRAAAPATLAAHAATVRHTAPRPAAPKPAPAPAPQGVHSVPVLTVPAGAGITSPNAHGACVCAIG